MSTATIEHTHPAYAKSLPQWQKCRDVYEGEDAIKAAGKKYLPKLDGQSDTAYQAYVTRAEFFNGFARSVNGLAGTALAVPPTLKVPTAMEEQLRDATLAGEPIGGLIGALVEEGLKVSRHGLLLDYSETAKRPYVVSYTAEQIRDWDTVVVDGDVILSYLVLEEVVTQREGFEIKHVTQYRRLRLVPEGPAGALVVDVQVWQKTGGDGPDKDTWRVIQTIRPERRGVRLTFLPFVIISSNGITPDVRKPAMLDLVAVNLSHYRTSADLEHGRHFTGLPQPVVIGATPDKDVQIDSSKVWPLPVGGDAKYMEFTGTGLKTLETALDQKERRMAVLGSRMLEPQKKAVEAAAALKMRQAGDDATLASVVGAIELGLTFLLRRWAWWGGYAQTPDAADIAITLNKDFVGTDIPLDSLSLLAQAEKLSFATLYYNLERAGLTRPGITAEQERQQILLEGGSDPHEGAPHAGVPTPKPKAGDGGATADDENDDLGGVQ